MKLKRFKHEIYKKEGIKLFVSNGITIIEVSKKNKLFIFNTPDAKLCSRFNTILDSTGNIQIAFLHRFQYNDLIDGLTFNRKLTDDEIFSVDCTLRSILFENKKLMKILKSDKPYLPKEKSKKAKNKDMLKRIDELTTKLDALLNAGMIKVSDASKDAAKPSTSKNVGKRSTTRNATKPSTAKNATKPAKSSDIVADNTYYNPNYIGTDTIEMDYLKDATDNM